MGRAGMVGDELGSAVIGARLVRDIMRLCFLMERCYAPYAKWFGTAFNRLKRAQELQPVLEAAVHSRNWKERERHLVIGYESIAAAHNSLNLTPALPTQTRLFFGRPFRAIALNGFAQALIAEIRDPAVKRIAERPLIGSLDLLSDSSDLTEDLYWRPFVRRFYEAG